MPPQGSDTLMYFDRLQSPEKPYRVVHRLPDRCNAVYLFHFWSCFAWNLKCGLLLSSSCQTTVQFFRWAACMFSKSDRPASRGHPFSDLGILRECRITSRSQFKIPAAFSKAFTGSRLLPNKRCCGISLPHDTARPHIRFAVLCPYRQIHIRSGSRSTILVTMQDVTPSPSLYLLYYGLSNFTPIPSGVGQAVSNIFGCHPVSHRTGQAVYPESPAYLPVIAAIASFVSHTALAINLKLTNAAA